MVERAHSIEINKEITAKKASELSRKNVLSNAKKFYCIDPNCEIDLTCTNWKKKGKKYYFTPSSKDGLHIFGCTEISTSEAKAQSKKESVDAKKTISKNGIIKMTKSVNKVRSTTEPNNTDIITNTSKLSCNFNIGKKEKKESRHMYSIASFVDLFNDNDVDNNTQFVSIEQNKISLNDLFIESSSEYPVRNTIRIFFGKAKLKSISFDKQNLKSNKKDVLEIEFINSNFPKLYSNITILSKRSTTSNVLDYIDTNKYTTVYFRGILVNSGKKFKSFNDKVYKDLLFC